MTARIRGVEYALPERVVGNGVLASIHPNWRIDDVAKRTGVLERRIAAPGETALDLGERAARALLMRLGIAEEEVDALLFCTETPDHPIPPNACLLQARLGLSTRTAALDFTLACSGYVYGLYLAQALIDSRLARSVLLVTGDTYSRLISPDDRSTVALFGDAAAATVVDAAVSGGIRSFDLGTDGGRASCFIVPAGGTRQPRSTETSEARMDRSGNVRSAEQIRMDGTAVLAFVQREVPASARRALDRAGLKMRDVDLVVFHQASLVSLEYLARTLEVREDQMVVNIEKVGNTVSASLPIALRDMESAGRLRRGHLVLLVGFGVGLSWGSCVLEW